MTNYEKIKSMSVEEMAKFIYEVYLEGYDDGNYRVYCGTLCDKNWLESEVVENDEL